MQRQGSFHPHSSLIDLKANRSFEIGVSPTPSCVWDDIYIEKASVTKISNSYG